MCDVTKLCVVDCGEVIARYQQRYTWLSDTDVNAVLVAAASAALDNVKVDPILDVSSKLSLGQADVMIGALCAKVLDGVQSGMAAVLSEAGDDQTVTTRSQLEGNLVIVNITLSDEPEE